MPKLITIDDCKAIKHKFDEFAKTAEQHQFMLMFVIDRRLISTIADFEENGVDQEIARAMFRIIGKVIGMDTSEYNEPEEEIKNDSN